MKTSKANQEWTTMNEVNFLFHLHRKKGGKMLVMNYLAAMDERKKWGRIDRKAVEVIAGILIESGPAKARKKLTA